MENRAESLHAVSTRTKPARYNEAKRLSAVVAGAAGAGAAASGDAGAAMACKLLPLGQHAKVGQQCTV